MTIRRENKISVTDITSEGFWLHTCSRRYYVSFEKHPYFLGASVEEIQQVTICREHVSWEALEIDLCTKYIEQPKRGTYLGFSKKQLERLYKYNKEQIEKGGKPYENARLLDFPYWRELNKNHEVKYNTKKGGKYEV